MLIRFFDELGDKWWEGICLLIAAPIVTAWALLALIIYPFGWLKIRYVGRAGPNYDPDPPGAWG